MIISLNWLKNYARVEVPVDELAKLIGERLVEIEDVIDLGERYNGIVVAEITEKKPHPNADKLDIYMANVGKDELMQVVSGDRNLQVGDKVGWIPAGSTVPSTFSSGNPVILEARSMRGETSYGMFGSGKELGLNEEHLRVQVLDTQLPAGTSFAEAYELNDYLLDIENKSLTHRPDCFGLVGFAREVAAILGQQFTTPTWLQSLEPVLEDRASVDGVEALSVEVLDQKACPRYQAVTIAHVDAKKKSPLQIQSYLQRVGMRPIGAVVDITNYLMLVTGQPLHAFDYDKVVAEHPQHKPEIKVRLSREGERLTLLDGRSINLSNEDILICAGDKPIALGGAMGGETTEVSDETTNLILESASFDLYHLRTTVMRHGIASEAATRFTKGQPPALTAPVLASAVRMLCDVAGGVRAGEIADVRSSQPESTTITLTTKYTNEFLGSRFSTEEIADILQHVECIVKVNSDELHITPPYWRNDLHIPQDSIEEIARINGYDAIETTLPKRDLRATKPLEFDALRSDIRRELVRAGANEVLTYSFVPGKLLDAAGQDSEKAYKITNALSPDLQYFRLSLLPSLVSQVHPNIKAGHDNFALFELNRLCQKDITDEYEPDLPAESINLGLVVAANDKYASVRYQGAPYYQAKAMLDYLAAKLHVAFSYQPLGESNMSQWSMPLEPKRSAEVYCGETHIGFIGEFKQKITSSTKLPQFVAGFELDLIALYEQARHAKLQYKQLSRFPGTEQDICLRVENDVTYGRLYDLVNEFLGGTELLTSVAPVDIYQREDDKDHKQITLRLHLQHPERTLKTDEINTLLAEMSEKLANVIKASRL